VDNKAAEAATAAPHRLLYHPLFLRGSGVRWLTPFRLSILILVAFAPISLVAHIPLATVLLLSYEVGIANYIVDRQQLELKNLRQVLSCDDARYRQHLDSLTRHPGYLIGLSWVLGPLTTLLVNFNGPTLTALRAGADLTPATISALSIRSIKHVS
jgi:hypothetical protein